MTRDLTKRPSQASPRKGGDGEQMTSTIILMVVVIAVGFALWMFAQQVLMPVIRTAAANLNQYNGDSQSFNLGI